MQELLNALIRIQDRLDQANIRYALIGGVATGVWGAPRATDDVDLKVDAVRNDVPALVAAVAPDFVPAEGAIEIVKELGVLFLDSAEGIRVDLLLSELGFDRQAIDRAVELDVRPGLRSWVCTAEDLIVYKLLTSRPIDFEDVRKIVREQKGSLDRAYIERTLRDFELALDDSGLVENFRSIGKSG